MKTQMRTAIPILISLCALGGCDNTMSDQEAAATLIGAIGGGVIGAQFGTGAGQVAAAAGGALLGGVFGNAFGRNLAIYDINESSRAFMTASRAPVGQTIYWSNVRTGNWGSYQPLRDGHRRFDGMYCREFSAVGQVRGRTQKVYGAACRLPNGAWEPM